MLESDEINTTNRIMHLMHSLAPPLEFRNRRILVAEDNASNRTVIQQWLAMAGIDVVLAGTGAEACAALAVANPDLVFMDVRMPDMDGIEATCHMRMAGYSKPIVGLSAASRNTDQNACLNAGMNDFLAKPIDADELWGCLTRWLSPSAEPGHGIKSDDDTDDTSAEMRFLDNADALARAREIFIACHRDDSLRLQSMLADGNYGDMANLAHTLNGSAATIGLDALSKLALALEKKIQIQASREDLLQLIHWIDNQLVHLVECS